MRPLLRYRSSFRSGFISREKFVSGIFNHRPRKAKASLFIIEHFIFPTGIAVPTVSMISI
jgi:hypothetical protein